MSTPHDEKPSNPPASTKRAWLAVLAVAALAVLAVPAWRIWRSAQQPRDAVAVFEVEHGPLTINVTESGTIQNRDLVVVKSEVEGRASLLFLIPEGTMVEKGQLLVDLDSSSLVDQKTQQQITAMNAEAALVRAQQNLAMTTSQSESDISKAALDVSFAKMDNAMYIEGDFKQQVRQSDADITIAREELQRANDQLEWSTRLAAEKYITRTELQADNLTAKRWELNLQLALTRRDLLQQYTYTRRVEELRSNIEQAAAALERVKLKARADLVQAEADLKAKTSEYNRHKARLEKLDEQIVKCKIYAPVAGMVVYSTTGKASFRGGAEPLAEGQEIRERQDLIYLPTTTSMMAQVKIHESSLRKIRKDLPVRVTVDAVPGKMFVGRVGKIGLLPDAQSMWMNPDLKLYDTEIILEGDATDLRAGMTCKAEIIVATYDDAVYVPVQSVVRVQGKTTVYLPGRDAPTPRPVVIGMDNNRMVHVVSGLAPGEQVLLAPPLGPSSVSMTAEQTTGGLPPVPPPAPATKAAAPDGGGDAATPPPSDPSKRPKMTPEEWQKRLESMTPEEREKAKARMGARKPRGDNANPPPAEGP